MGGPKALLELDGAPLLERHIERALGLGSTHVAAIVTPELYALFAPALERLGTRLSLIAARTDSQASSLARLVQALARADAFSPLSTFLITPVDVLPCSAATYRALHAALAPEVCAATPRFSGRGGHPVLVRAELLQAYRDPALSEYPSLREVLGRAGARRREVVVDDPAVATDVDTSAQARALGLIVPW
jgi:CTP:molybdopterin cytidylyltransferase MocA